MQSAEPKAAATPSAAPLKAKDKHDIARHFRTSTKQVWEYMVLGLVIGLILACITLLILWLTVWRKPHAGAQSSRFALVQRMPWKAYNNSTPESALKGMASDLQSQLHAAGDKTAVVTVATPAHLQWLARFGNRFGDNLAMSLDTSESAMVDGCSAPGSTAPKVSTDTTNVWWKMPKSGSGLIRGEGRCVWGGLIITSTNDTQTIMKAIAASNKKATAATSKADGGVNVAMNFIMTSNTASAMQACATA